MAGVIGKHILRDIYIKCEKCQRYFSIKKNINARREMMKILRTAEEYKKILELKKKAAEQTKKCPECGVERKEIWLGAFNKKTITCEKEICFHSLQELDMNPKKQAYKHRCKCNECGAVWETEEIPGEKY